MHQCTKCHQTFSQKGNLSVHIKRVHVQTDQNVFHCNQCDGHFKKLASFNSHLSRHANQEPNINDIIQQINELGESVSPNTIVFPRIERMYLH